MKELDCSKPWRRVIPDEPMKRQFSIFRPASVTCHPAVVCGALGVMTSVAVLLAATCITTVAQTATITFVGVTLDQTNFQALGFGQAGYYFPQFGTNSPVTLRPTWENMQFNPPSWASFQFDSTQPDRTFSLDAAQSPYNILFGDLNDPMDLVEPFGDPLVAGVYSKGGQSNWNMFTLPNGVTGLSGAAVDEWATTNSNNSVNRIQLGTGTPSSFLLRLVVDNTNLEHDPAGQLRARSDVSNDANPTSLVFNGIADVYTFRYDNFAAGNYIKIRLNSGAEVEAPSIGGILFDLVTETPPTLSVQPTNNTQLMVSWPASTPSTFMLETTTNLTLAGVWTEVTNSVSVSGTNKFVILEINAAELGQYYRLQQ